MKNIVLIGLLLMIVCPLNAAQKKKHHNPKKYIKGDELFLYPHGIYLAYPGKLYRISALYKSRHGGYYTYRSKIYNFPLSEMSKYNWGRSKRINFNLKSE